MTDLLLMGVAAIAIAAIFLALAWSVQLHKSQSKARTRTFFAIQALLFGLLVLWTGPEVVFTVLGLIVVLSFAALMALVCAMALRTRLHVTDMSFERVMAANIIVSPVLLLLAVALRVTFS